MKNMAALCSCVENLPEAELRNFWMNGIGREISNSLALTELSVASLMQIHNGKEQAEQAEIQNVQFEEKRGTRKCHGTKSSAQGN